MKSLRNGLHQGLVIFPIFFNDYTVSIPKTISKKFIYADGVGIIAQGKLFEELEKTLSKDLFILKKNSNKWYLILNAGKPIAIVFHLDNREASKPLQLAVNNTNIANDDGSSYLNVKLNITLTYKQLIDTMKNKLKTT